MRGLAENRLSVQRDGRDWPNRSASRFVEAAGLRWHVQRMGRGPVLLLVHGTGSATHSWRALAPLLGKSFDVVAFDLPGHGFTDALDGARLSLPGMARAIAALLRELEISPEIVVGHSAGAAILARMCLDGLVSPRLLISLNGAFLPFEGLAGALFPPMAKLLFLNPFAPRLFARSADSASVARLLGGTGSRIDAAGVALYAKLFGNAAHVAGTLGMMANWDLAGLQKDLPRLATPLALVFGALDRAVPPEATERLERHLKRQARADRHVTRHRLPGLGHLAHEERPEVVADLIGRLAEQALNPAAHAIPT